MKESLLLIERIIIESLSKKEKTLSEIMVDTGLTHALLLNLLPGLLMRNLIRYTRGNYFLENTDGCLTLSQVNKNENVKEEVKELFVSLVNQYFKNDQLPRAHLRVQKVWLTQDEEVVLKSHIAVLDMFLNGIKSTRRLHPERERTCEQKVLVWGFSRYSNLVDDVLSSV